MQVTGREARQVLYWRICHRYTDTHRPHPRTRPGPSPGPRTLTQGVPSPGPGELSVPPPGPSLPAQLPRGPQEKSQPLGMPRGPGEAPQSPLDRAPSSRSPSLPTGWVVNPRSWEQVQGPQAWAGGMGHTLGSGSASALAQARRGAPVSPREDAVVGAGWGPGGQEEGASVISPCRIRDPGQGGALRLAPPGRARVRLAGRTRMGAAPCWGCPRGTGCGGRSRPCRGREAPRGRPPGLMAAPERGGRGESPEPQGPKPGAVGAGGPRPGSEAPRASLRCRPARPLHLSAPQLLSQEGADSASLPGLSGGQRAGECLGPRHIVHQ